MLSINAEIIYNLAKGWAMFICGFAGWFDALGHLCLVGQAMYSALCGSL
jgi:hypothetical protein